MFAFTGCSPLSELLQNRVLPVVRLPNSVWHRVQCTVNEIHFSITSLILLLLSFWFHNTSIIIKWMYVQNKHLWHGWVITPRSTWGCSYLSTCKRPGMGVTKAPFVNFSVSKMFDLAKVPAILFTSHSYLTGVTAAELRQYLSNMNMIFNR